MAAAFRCRATAIRDASAKECTTVDFVLLELKAAAAGGALALVLWGAIAAVARVVFQPEDSDMR